MKVSIEIKTCHDCQHLDHNGRLQADPSYVCDLMLCLKHGRKRIKRFSSGDITKIPNWCPLKSRKGE